MQNQQEVTFVFGNNVKGFLKRYQADTTFAQEARKKAPGVLDGSVQLICSDDIHPLALRLLRRLVNSDTQLFSFFVKKDVDAVVELGRRLRGNAKFAKWVFHRVVPAAAAGRLDLRCKEEDRRHLHKALLCCWSEQSATRNGWQTLVRRTHPLTREFTLTKVAPWEIGENSFTENSGRDFKVIRRLGYLPTITWEEARTLDQKDPTHRVHLHGASAPSFEHARYTRDTSRNLDPLLSPHFGDEDDVEERAKVAQRADELVSEATEAIFKDALSELASESEAVSSFVPPSPTQKLGRGGSSAYWASELGKGVRIQKAQCTPGPRWPHKAPSDEWLTGRKAAQKVSEEVAQRQALLDADDAEVRAFALSDVPETTVSLLEKQLEEGKRKAPKGVVAALAAARLEAARNGKRISQSFQGLADLEAAAAR